MDFVLWAWRLRQNMQESPSSVWQLSLTKQQQEVFTQFKAAWCLAEGALQGDLTNQDVIAEVLTLFLKAHDIAGELKKLANGQSGQNQHADDVGSVYATSNALLDELAVASGIDIRRIVLLQGLNGEHPMVQVVSAALKQWRARQ